MKEGTHYRKKVNEEPVESLVPEVQEEPRRIKYRAVPDRWPGGWCYVCAQQIPDKKKKLCPKHEDWVYRKYKEDGKSNS